VVAVKRRFAEWLLPSCPYVLVDGRRPDVEVPEFLRVETLGLRIGRDPNELGMPDLELDDEGWSATISVRGALYRVRVSWAAVSRMWVGPPFTGPSIAWPEEEVSDVGVRSTGFRVLPGGKS
jgi:hypothetical protein